MDTRFIDRELAAWERLQRLASERGIELPPELAVECGEDSLAWSEAKCIEYLERELARRLAGLARITTPRTELPLPSRPMPERVERDYATSRAFQAAMRAKERIQVQGAVNTLKAARADERQARRQAAAARRKTSGR